MIVVPCFKIILLDNIQFYRNPRRGVIEFGKKECWFDGQQEHASSSTKSSIVFVAARRNWGSMIILLKSKEIPH